MLEKKEEIRLVATDLDGTFLKDDRTVSQKCLEALELLGRKNITRVVATGRNMLKVRDVLDEQVPFDFIVYSSGAGIYDWKNRKNIFTQNINSETSKKLLSFFVQKKLNFHAFFPSPENHKHWYWRGENGCEEFERYFNYNKKYGFELKEDEIPDTELSQLLIFIPENKGKFEHLKKEIEKFRSDIRVIRTSSPITRGYIWIEIFHKSVSKGNGVKHICDLKGIDRKQTLGIGNDYNDLDLLEFTNHSFVTENAPEEIKVMFQTVPSNEKDGFVFAVQPII